MGNWTIKNVSEDVRDKIKEEARNNGLTIGNYLAVLFDGEMKSLGYQWTISGVDKGTAKKLIRNARSRKLSLADYLKEVANDDKGERAIKAVSKIIEIVEEI